MGVKRQREEEAISMTIAPEMAEQIRANAAELGLNFDSLVRLYLKLGLEVHAAKQAHLRELVEKYRNETDPDKRNELGDQLGTSIFG